MNMELKGISFSYDGRRQIFKDIDLSIASGEIVCILGPNGIGKTTLLHCMARLHEPGSGTITLDGRDMAAMSHQEIARIVGYVPQLLQASFEYSVLEYVVTGQAPWLGIFEKPGPLAWEKAREALAIMEISHLAHQSYTRLSGGELQQVSIARAITQEARFILLDEPTAHLDYGNQLKVLRIVKDLARQGYGIVLTTHNPDHVLLLEAKTALFDREARFHFGPWQEILTDELLSSIYNVPLRLMNVEGIGRKVCIAPAIAPALTDHPTEEPS